MISLKTIVRASSAHVSSPLGDELVVLDTENGVYYGLNPMSAFIWAQIQQPTPVSDLRDAIMGAFEVDPALCVQDLVEVLTNMHASGLITLTDAS